MGRHSRSGARHPRSPYPVVSRGQIVVIAGIALGLAIAAVLAPLALAVTLSGILLVLFTASNLLKLVTVRQALRDPVVLRVADDEIRALAASDLPVYTLLIPLYHEAQIASQLIAGIRTLEYPRDKLDIKILLEADDAETRAAIGSAQLPEGAEVLTVPDWGPKGKPRACNVGLSRARGQYLVIYDAEDRPEPQQLLKAVAAFQKVGPWTVCLQAKLSYYNRTQNLLTRLGTAEYSAWFDLLLPGMQSLDVAMPLGGTSNHFVTERLRELGGWEAYNVTEDADLGVRLYAVGFKAAMFESTTYEEANCRLGNWLRQRSRWTKGYMQTYLAHMRHPLRQGRRMGPRAFLVFQLFFGVATLGLLCNPLYWGLAVAWFTWHVVGIESVFPRAILYAGTINLLIGNLAFLLTTMSGCFARRNYRDVKWMLASPLYWALISIAAWKALLQLASRPYYWEKTTHGFWTHAASPGGSDDRTTRSSVASLRYPES